MYNGANDVSKKGNNEIEAYGQFYAPENRRVQCESLCPHCGKQVDVNLGVIPKTTKGTEERRDPVIACPYCGSEIHVTIQVDPSGTGTVTDDDVEPEQVLADDVSKKGKRNLIGKWEYESKQDKSYIEFIDETKCIISGPYWGKYGGKYDGSQYHYRSEGKKVILYGIIAKEDRTEGTEKGSQITLKLKDDKTLVADRPFKRSLKEIVGDFFQTVFGKKKYIFLLCQRMISSGNSVSTNHGMVLILQSLIRTN